MGGRGRVCVRGVVDGSCIFIRSNHSRENYQWMHTWNRALSQELDHWSALSSSRGLPESSGRKHLRDCEGKIRVDEAGGDFQDPAGVAWY